MRRECPEWDVPPEWVTVARIGDLLDTDPEIQRILNSAAGVPGDAPANAGVIGEIQKLSGTVQIPAFSISPPYDTIVICNPSLPPGDWFLWSSATWQRAYPGVSFGLQPPPPGFTGSLAGGFWGGQYADATVAVGVPCHARTTLNSGLVFNLNINPGASTFTTGTLTLQVEAQRLR